MGCLLALTILLLLVFARPTWAADLPVSVVALSSPVAPFSNATLEISDAPLDIQTTPGAPYAIRVNSKSGPSRAKGLVPKTAVWQWRVGSNTTSGWWPSDVTCQQGEARGDVRTSFEVR